MDEEGEEGDKGRGVVASLARARLSGGMLMQMKGMEDVQRSRFCGRVVWLLQLRVYHV